jgi:DNA-binding transcriptional MerR regulator
MEVKKMNVFESFRGFWGTAAELSERAKTLGKAVGVKPEKLTMRLIRYYAAQGVLDKPNRLGREAAFHFKHMLQLLVARKLVDEGVPLEVIGKFNLDASMEKLEQELLKPEKDRATLITEKYRKEIISSKITPNNSKQQLLEEKFVTELSEWKKDVEVGIMTFQKTAMNFEILLESYTKEQNYLLEKIKYDQEEKVSDQIKNLQYFVDEFLNRMRCEHDNHLRHVEEILERAMEKIDRNQHAFEDQIQKLSFELSECRELVTSFSNKLEKNILK